MRFVAFKAAICNDKRLLVEVAALEHGDQRPDLVFLRFGLNDNIGKNASENVVQRRRMELVYAFWDAVVLDKGCGGRVTRKADRCSVYG